MNNLKADLADLALYLGTSHCDILISNDATDICVSAGGFPFEGELDVVRVIEGCIVEGTVRVNDFITYSYEDLGLALDFYTGQPEASPLNT